jgi:hypothetical protein
MEFIPEFLIGISDVSITMLGPGARFAYNFFCMSSELIPVNVKGKPTDLQFSIAFSNTDKARHCYMRAIKRMQNPGIWHELAGWVSASFILIDVEADVINRLASEGDYIRIDIPGPGTTEGGGYDWVKIEKMEEYIDSSEHEWTGMKVRPCGNPGFPGPGTAHFFTREATSTFIIQRDGHKVTAFYHGRNEVPNTSTRKWTDKVRNSFVAAGAVVGLSEAQWSALCKGFLAEEIGGKPRLAVALPYSLTL